LNGVKFVGIKIAINFNEIKKALKKRRLRFKYKVSRVSRGRKGFVRV
jgi:hypothetical protein